MNNEIETNMLAEYTTLGQLQFVLHSEDIEFQSNYMKVAR